MEEHRKATTLLEIIEKVKNEEKTGIVYINDLENEEFISYKTLYYNALKVLYNMQNEGIKPGNEVVFQFAGNKEFINVFWACILGGFIPVTLKLAENEEEKLRLKNVLEILERPYVVTDEDNIFKENGEGVIYKAKTSDIAMIQFSSGSTGVPKGVIITHDNLIKNLEAAIKTGMIDGGNSVLSWVPLSHDLGLIGMHIAPIMLNITQYNMKTELFLLNPLSWLDKVNEHRVSFIASPNFGYAYILKLLESIPERTWDLSCVKRIFNGAESISADICTKFFEAMNKYNMQNNIMVNIYGLAEACLVVTVPPIGEKIKSYNLKIDSLVMGKEIVEALDGDENSRKLVDLGYPVENCSIKICGTDGNELPEKYVGRIMIKGAIVTSGYYRNIKLTKEVLTKDGWLNTGDIGFIKDGRLVIAGREKEIMVINGKNFYPSDVERIIQECINISIGEAAVCSFVEGEDKQEKIAAFIVNNNLNGFLKKERAIKESVNRKMCIVVNKVIPVKTIPRTASGKIRRLELGRMYEEGRFSKVLDEINLFRKNNEEVIPVSTSLSEVERNLLKICEEIFKSRNLGVNDNFFEIGVDSLKASLVIAKIKEKFNVEISIKQLFVSSNIRDLAKCIEEASKSSEIGDIKKADLRDYYVTTSSQKMVYFSDKTNENSIVYNLPKVFIIEGDINKEKFKDAFKKLIVRHEALRTSFKEINGNAVQVIHSTVDFDLEEYNYSDFKDIDHIIRKFVRPFDLKKAPLIRAGLSKISDKKYLMLFDIHHIISDGTSMGIILKDLI